MVKRIETSDIINYRDNTHVITDYRYDSFGRRTHTAERTKWGMRTIYDGLSFEVVKEAETFLGTRGITSSATGEANLTNYNPHGSDHTRGTRYYFIRDRGQELRTDKNGEALPDRTKGVRTYLYLNGERVAVNNLYNTNHGQYYYGSDILGSVKFVTGQGGQELKRIEYDIFGGIYKGNSPYGLETGYTGKPYDSVTGLSDYGFRDYSPTHARFITEDPIRDGTNWFAYCYADPINHIDPNGYWTVSITFNGAAGAGTETTGGVGVVIGFSFEKGLSFGLVETHSIGAQQGATAGIGISVGINFSEKEVVSGTSTSLTVGGSGNASIAGMPLGIGLDASTDLETKQTAVSIGIGAGIGTAVEVHQLYTVTNTLAHKDLTQMLIDYMTPSVIKQAEQEQHKPSVPQKHWPTMEQQSPKKKSA